jgi:hypothetical protein
MHLPAVLANAIAAAVLSAGAASAQGREPAQPAAGHDHAKQSDTRAPNPVDHSNHGAPAAGSAKPPLSEASKALDAVMQRMHQEMSLPYTNDVDIDFVRGMIPHHQGAIDQAYVLLRYSKNPRLRRLAGGIIASQKREILFMKKWLEENGRGTEVEFPEWLKNTAVPDDARDPVLDR